MHGLFTTPYDATDVPESGADQRSDGGHEDHSHAICFRTVFGEMRQLFIYTIFKEGVPLAVIASLP